MSVGQNISKYRKAMNITQAQLGKELNISAQAISKWERDLTEPDITALNKMSKYFDVSLNELIGNSEKTNINKEDNLKVKQNENINNPIQKELLQKKTSNKIITILMIISLISTLVISIISLFVLKNINYIWINIGFYILTTFLFVVFLVKNKQCNEKQDFEEIRAQEDLTNMEVDNEN